MPTLVTPEGMHYAPTLLTEFLPDGSLARLEVGIEVTGPNGEKHNVTVVPSTETGEGNGQGNVFIYEDDDALSHIAWSMPGDGTNIPAPEPESDPRQTAARLALAEWDRPTQDIIGDDGFPLIGTVERAEWVIRTLRTLVELPE